MTVGRTPAVQGRPEGPTGSRLADVGAVFKTALVLGLTSFGGPIAHFGYFERAYVQRRRWLDAEDLAGMIALCQTLPGPSSSQVGFLIGLKRAGLPGALAAWLGFTLPSALAMVAVAVFAPRLHGPAAASAFHGLQVVAVPVVAQAVWRMGKTLCPDAPRAALAAAAAAAALFWSGAGASALIILAAGGLAGAALLRGVKSSAAPLALPISRRAGLICLGVFAAVLFALQVGAAGAPRSLLDVAARFYTAGALVFGGGHVVLPLLRGALVPSGYLTDTAFLSGYGAAQALPGPLFAFAAYLGAAMAPPAEGAVGLALWSAACVVAIFTPGMLLALAGAPLWSLAARGPIAQAALAGVNAAVVGLLAAAFCNPVATTGIRSGWDLVIAGLALIALERRLASPILIVVFCVASSMTLELIL